MKSTKTVVAVKGRGGQGKSATVREIYNELMSAHSGVHTTLIKPEGLTSGDIKIIIEAKGKRIGIESQGDPNSRLLSSLPLFVKHNCDIIICSTRSGGGTVWAVEDLRNSNGYNLVWTSNYRSDDFAHGVLNQQSAKHIVEMMMLNSII